MENHGAMTRQGKFLIRPPQLSGNHTNWHIVAKKEEVAKERNLVLGIVSVHRGRAPNLRVVPNVGT
jgi:hypothetical protein